MASLGCILVSLKNSKFVILCLDVTEIKVAWLLLELYLQAVCLTSKLSHERIFVTSADGLIKMIKMQNIQEN